MQGASGIADHILPLGDLFHSNAIFFFAMVIGLEVGGKGDTKEQKEEKISHMNDIIFVVKNDSGTLQKQSVNKTRGEKKNKEKRVWS